MNTLPIVLFTKNRTACACATVDALLSNLKTSGWAQRHILCDDMSVPGHVEAVLEVYKAHGVPVTLLVTNAQRHGLGASMNLGLDAAFSDPEVSKCFRLEDDWLLKRELDIGPWLDRMDDLQIGSLRMGMMFRKRHECLKFKGDSYNAAEDSGLYRIASTSRQLFTFNNQLAVISRRVYDIVGRYPENDKPSATERHGGRKYNAATEFGHKPPYVAWPEKWETQVFYGDKMAFAHIGVSISGHKHLYHVAQKYLGYNDPKKDEELRKAALA